MYKSILSLILSLLLITPCYAKKNQLVICLGKEEGLIHKNRISGPTYKLNQYFISKLVSMDIHIKEKFLSQICSDSHNTSIRLLKLLMIQKDKCFKENNFTESPLYSYKQASKDLFIQDLPRVFSQYISNVQSLAPTKDCLEKRIPYLKEFLIKYSNLEMEDIPIDTIIDKNKILSIFEKLENINTIYKACHKDSQLKQNDQKS